MTTRRVEKSRTFPVSVERAYDVVLTTPLPEIFSRRFVAIAPIAAVDGQVGAWGSAVGQTRTIRLKDGGRMVETLTVIDQPNCFGYEMSDIEGPMKPLVASAEGMWTFEAAGTGVRITWRWDVTPKGRLGGMAMPVFARLWVGYARQAMDQIELLLVD